MEERSAFSAALHEDYRRRLDAGCYFVVLVWQSKPVPDHAVKRSAELFRDTWGEKSLADQPQPVL